MDHFTAFLIFAVLVAAEIAAGQSWLAGYYRLGIPVYFTRRELKKEIETANGAESELTSALEERFKSQQGYPAVRFKALAGSGQGRAAIAFHEALFMARSGPRYFSVMHSLAQVDRANGTVRVTGWLNWYVVFLLIYLVANTITDASFLFVAVLVLVIFGLSYSAQVTVNRKVAEEVQTFA